MDYCFPNGMQPVAKDCICFASDAAYLPHFATALASIADNAAGFDVFLFGDGLTENQFEHISRFAEKLKVNLTIFDIDGINLAGLVTDHHTRATWIRVIAPQVIPTAYRRMLYLDCDIVVVGSLQELVNAEIGDFSVAAVLDGSSKISDLEKQTLGMPKEAGYFNTGVLLIDLAKWRVRGYSEKILSYARANPDKINYVDQGPINKICWKDILSLSEIYNYGVHGTEERPVVIHYYGRTKPWLYQDAPGYGFYKFYRNKTPFSFVSPKAKKYASIRLVKLGLLKNRILRVLKLGASNSKLHKIQRNIDKLEQKRMKLVRLNKIQKRLSKSLQDEAS